MLKRAYAILLALSAGQAAQAAIPPGPTMQTAELHALIEVTTAPQPPQNLTGACTVQARVLRVFHHAGGPAAAPGSTVTLAFPCARAARSGEVVPPPLLGGGWWMGVEGIVMAMGQPHEAFLRADRQMDGPCGTYGAPRPGAWQVQLPFQPNPGQQPLNQVNWQPRGPEQPLVPPPPPTRQGAAASFPINEGVMEYTVSSRPGERFRAHYSLCNYSARFEALGRDGQAADGATILSYGQRSAMRVFDREQRVEPMPVQPGDRLGGVAVNWDSARFELGGMAQVAGEPCNNFTITERVGSVERQHRACVTPDGFVLRREADGVVTEATALRRQPVPYRLVNPPISYRGR
ncbi:hypothetical protein EOD42_11755 [Rhodovarius crocodyli]|uniref:Uncharacterized protein n=1 Tax=Rhodovarius crocodyli TaxID=1979269 RepID=A0A437MHE1_9PROT|nr:hypothetical protein [Rhodovarius crocodyli]RVT97059.1 hypothetical protein EOD42_11755 [Rhodovarius crocodyli]